MMRMEDGVDVALDWSRAPAEDRKDRTPPIVLICHGLAGGSLSPHIRVLVRILADCGFSSVVYNRWVHGGTAIDPSGPASCHEAERRIYPQHFDREDFQQVVCHVKETSDNRGIIGVGLSAGGNALACHLAATCADSGIAAGVVVSNGFEVWKAMQRMRSEARMFDALLTHLMKGILRAHLPGLSEHPRCAWIDFHDILRQTSLLEFESRFAAHVRGYSCAEEYYMDNSSLGERLFSYAYFDWQFLIC
jgi:predicted alpha/beta-fold hydrolase